LIEGLNVHQRESVAHCTKDDGTKNCAENAAFATHQRSPANSSRRNRIKFPKVAENRFGSTQSANQYKRGQRGKSARYDIGRDLGAGDRNAGHIGSIRATTVTMRTGIGMPRT